MHTITETRRDLSTQIDNFPPNLLNNNNVNVSAQNRGGGDGVTAINTGQTMIPFVGQQPNLSHMPSCRNTTNYFHAERNEAVRQLWRQHTHSCMNQRSNTTAVGNQSLPSSPQQQQHSVVNHFGRLEQSQQLYSNLFENNAHNRQSQLLNNTMHIEQTRRNYLPSETHNLLQQPATMDQTVFLNYTSNNISHYPNPIGGNTNSPFLSVPQYNYQNLTTPVVNHNSTTQQSIIPSPTNYPVIHPPLPSPQLQSLVFGPPPRDRRPNINNLDEASSSNRNTTFPEVFNNQTYFHDTNNNNNTPSTPINSIFQSFSNLKIPEQLNRLALSASQDQRNTNNNIFLNKSQMNRNHQCGETNDCSNNQILPPIIPRKSYYVVPTNAELTTIMPDVNNITDTDGNKQIYSARSNMKLKFSKNVVNIPKKIENNKDKKIEPELLPTKDTSIKTCTNDLYISNNIKPSPVITSQQYVEDVFNCNIYPNNNNKIDDSFNFPASIIDDEHRHNSPFVLHEESAFIDMVVEGCIHGEEIATKYQNVPCFKNIKKLCEKTKSDLMTPHCTARNIHSQGIPWATKDYIFAFTRLTSCWYLLKGYLGHKSDVFDKIEQLYSPDLRKSFELWEQTTVNLAFHIMKSFIALGNNSSVKWNPNAHSTPLTTRDSIRKKIVSIPSSLMTIDLDETSKNNKAELQILARANLDTTYSNSSPKQNNAPKNDDKNAVYLNNNNRIIKDFQNHIFKPIIQMNTRYDFDSGDEGSSKKYIKPGCYSVPQIRNSNSTSTTSPKLTTFNDIDDVNNSKKKMSPIIILSHRNEQQTLKNTNNVTLMHNTYSSSPQGGCNKIEYIPFKETPQGIITSALMKKTREDFPKASANLNNQTSNVGTECKLFDSLKMTKNTMNNIENVSNTTDLYAMKLNSNDVSNNNNINCKLNVEKCVEVDDNIECIESRQVNNINNCKDEHNELNQQQQQQLMPNKIYGTSKKPYRNNIETKSSIRKGVFVKRRSDHHTTTSDYQTKSASIKKAHKSYYNTILSAPKYLDENGNNNNNNNNLKRQKYRENVKWNIWYSRKRDGLSHLAIETFERILNELWNMPSSHYFVFEVDVRDVPDYYEIIKHPMFLTNILQKLRQYKYNNLNQVVHDFRRIFRNARIFLEAHPDKRLQRLISNFSNAFEQLLNDSFPKMDFSTIMGEDNEILSETNTSKNTTSSRSSTPSKSDDNTSPSSQEDR